MARPPLLCKEGNAPNPKSVSNMKWATEAADGVVAHATRFTNAFRSIACERPPRPRLFSERIHFAKWRVHPSFARRGMHLPQIGVKHEVGHRTRPAAHWREK